VVVTAKDVGEARQKLESWFNDGMNRTSQWYKERMQWISIIVAGILCFMLNVDALQLGRTLWEDPLLRAEIVQQATTFDQSRLLPAVGTTAPTPEPTPISPSNNTPPDETTEGTGETRDVTIIDPNTGEVLVLPAEESYLAEDTISAIVQAQQNAQESLQVLLDMQLPLGWEWQVVTDNMVQTSLQLGLSDPRQNPRNLWNFVQLGNSNWFGLLIQKIVGIIASTIAAAQGAPFWFDLLNRLKKGVV
jgi:hypothetical protein